VLFFNLERGPSLNTEPVADSDEPKKVYWRPFWDILNGFLGAGG
jgi:hypothetical protein